MPSYHIVVLPGDGIGPELTDVTLDVLRAVQQGSGFELRFDMHEAGAGTYLKTERNISSETLEACSQADATIKGPVGLPSVLFPDGTEAGVLGGVLRPGLDAYANVRPIRRYPNVQAALPNANIDYVVVRENTEGLYASRGRGFVTKDVVLDTMVISRHGVDRVCRKAFEMAGQRSGAPEDGVQRVTCVTKANVLRGFAFFRDIFFEVARDFPGIHAEELYADATAARMVQNPEHLDVIVTENMFGDILSDLGGGTIGGLGMCPSGNIGDTNAYFEPIHGSAPGIAGKDMANPISMVLSGAMMLDWLGQMAAGNRIRQAVASALADGAIRLLPNGCAEGGTKAAGRAIIERLG